MVEVRGALYLTRPQTERAPSELMRARRIDL